MGFDDARQLDTVDLRHHEVRQDGPRLFFRELFQCLGAVSRHRDAVAKRLEPELKCAEQIVFVVDQ